MKKTIVERVLSLGHITINKKSLIAIYLVCLLYNVVGLFFLLAKDYKLLVFINILSIMWIVYDILIIRKRRA